MTSFRVVLTICFTLVIGFCAGRLSTPIPVKASGSSAGILRVSPVEFGPAIVPSSYGTPTALSCSEGVCYVLVTR
jgi:hypothetical protein